MTETIHAAFHQPETRIYRVVQFVVWSLIILSIAILVIEAVVPETSAIDPLLELIDRVVLAIFAVEISARVLSYRPPALQVFQRPSISRLRVHLMARLRFMTKPLNLVDILAVLALFPELRGLRALRMLRLLRSSRIFQYRNPFAIILQTLEENGLLFGFAFSVLGVATTLGGVSFYLVEVRANPAVDSMLDGIWWALVTITTVGFGDITPVTLLGRILGGVLMIAGMFTLALFAGIVGSSFVTGMLSIREEQFRMSDYVNHVVVCGYDKSTHLLLDTLKREITNPQTRVVIFDEAERPRELRPEFLWVQGDPTKQSELGKVRLTHAAAVIVSGARDTSPQEADARTILTVFTVRAHLLKHEELVRERHCRLYVVAEILDSENVDHAYTAGADEVIETSKIGFSMLAHAVGFHGTATTMSRVLLSGAHNVYLGQVPALPAEGMRFGELLVQLALSKRGGLVVGVRTPAGEELINPAKDLMVEPGALLIYLAESPLLEPPQ